jgi:hypothetical protein
MKNSGKKEIIIGVVEAIRTIQGNSAEIIPISLTWRDTPRISSKEIQVKESLVANITCIHNKTINQTQHPKCQRRTPAHRQQDFLWV